MYVFVQTEVFVRTNANALKRKMSHVRFERILVMSLNNVQLSLTSEVVTDRPSEYSK